jgi:hypothetical protein
VAEDISPLQWRKNLKVYAQIGVSIFILAISAWVVLSGRFPQRIENGFFSLIGVVVGYWLK